MHSAFYRLVVALMLTLLTACGGRVPATSGQVAYQAVILSPTENAVYVFDLLTNRVRYRIRTGMTPRDLVIGAGGLVFVSHGQENSVTVLQRNDPFTWWQIGKIGTPSAPGRMAFDNDFQQLYVSASDRPLLSSYNMQGLRRPLLEQTLRLPAEAGALKALVLTPGGQTLYGAGDQLLEFKRANNELEVGRSLDLPEDSQISDMVLQGSTLWLSDRGLDRVYAVDTGTWSLTDTLELAEADGPPVLPERLVLNTAGSKLYLSGSANSVIKIIGTENREIIQTLALDGEDVRFPSGSPFGLAVAGDDTLYVTAQSGRNLAILETNPDPAVADRLRTTVGTAVSEALLPPLGDIQIF
ncbi:MAG: YncE family protein [Candidatus Sericytochromatia bacterium]